MDDHRPRGQSEGFFPESIRSTASIIGRGLREEVSRQSQKTSDKGIEKWLSDAGIEYHSLIELGNLFLEFTDWQDRYRQLLEQSGSLLIGCLVGLCELYCLLCAEKRVAECHRFQIAEYLAQTRKRKCIILSKTR